MFTVNLNKLYNRQNLTFAIFGDSIATQGFAKNGFVSHLKGLFSRDVLAIKLNCVNYAANGQGIARILQVMEQRKEQSKEWQLAIVFAGINDAWKVHKRKGANLIDFKIYLKQLRQLAQSYTCPVLYVMPHFIDSDDDAQTSIREFDALLQSYRHQIKKILGDSQVNTDNLTVLDLRQALSIYTELEYELRAISAKYTSDGVHFNEQGQKALADILFKAIDDLRQ